MDRIEAENSVRTLKRCETSWPLKANNLSALGNYANRGNQNRGLPHGGHDVADLHCVRARADSFAARKRPSWISVSTDSIR